MQQKSLTPRKLIEINGNLYYHETSQAWSIIRLKNELINEFFQLKEKRSKFSYKMIYYRDYEEFDKAVKELIKSKEILPILLFLKKEM